MKKIVCAILFVLLMSGCSAEYRIDITQEGINEKLVISNDNSFDEEEILDKNIGVYYYDGYNPLSLIKSPNKKYYEKEYENSKLTLTNVFDNETYSNTAIGKSCFESFSLSSDYYDLYLEASNFKCFDKYPLLEKVTLVVYIDSAIVSSNLEKIDQRTYTKIITRENVEEKIEFIFPIEKIDVDVIINRDEEGGSLEIDSESSSSINEQSSQTIEEKIDEKNDNKVWISLFLIFLVIASAVSSIILIKKKNKNNF